MLEGGFWLSVLTKDTAMPVTMVRTMTERVQAKLGDIEARLADAGKVSVLGGLMWC